MALTMVKSDLLGDDAGHGGETFCRSLCFTFLSTDHFYIHALSPTIACYSQQRSFIPRVPRLVKHGDRANSKGASGERETDGTT